MKEILIAQIDELFDDNLIGSLANTAAAIKMQLSDLNWVGFYFYHENALWLGPFCGKVACSKLPLQRGVCAHSFSEKKVTVVNDVSRFKGHIACDSESRSEIVLPLYAKEKIIGVLDIDSPMIDRFQAEDIALLEEIAKLVTNRLSEHHLKVS